MFLCCSIPLLLSLRALGSGQSPGKGRMKTSASEFKDTLLSFLLGGISLSVDVGYLPAPPSPLPVAHLPDLLPTPVKVIGNECNFPVQLILRVQPYPS